MKDLEVQVPPCQIRIAELGISAPSLVCPSIQFLVYRLLKRTKGVLHVYWKNSPNVDADILYILFKGGYVSLQSMGALLEKRGFQILYMELRSTSLYNGTIEDRCKLTTTYYGIPQNAPNIPFVQNHLLALPGIKFVSILQRPWRVSVTFDATEVSSDAVNVYLQQCSPGSVVVDSPSEFLRRTSSRKCVFGTNHFQGFLMLITATALLLFPPVNLLDKHHVLPGTTLRTLLSSGIGLTAFAMSQPYTAVFLWRNIEWGILTSLHFQLGCGSILLFLGLTMTLSQLIFWRAIGSDTNIQCAAEVISTGSILLAAPRWSTLVLKLLRERLINDDNEIDLGLWKTTPRLLNPTTNAWTATQSTQVEPESVVAYEAGDVVVADGIVTAIGPGDVLLTDFMNQKSNTTIVPGMLILAGQKVLQGELSLRMVNGSNSSLIHEIECIRQWQPLLGGEAACYSRRVRFIARWLGLLTWNLICLLAISSYIGGTFGPMSIHNMAECLRQSLALPFALLPVLLYDTMDWPLHMLKQLFLSRVGALFTNILDVRRVNQAQHVVVALSGSRNNLDAPLNCFLGVSLMGAIKSIVLESETLSEMQKISSTVLSLSGLQGICLSQSCDVEVVLRNSGIVRKPIVRQSFVVVLAASLLSRKSYSSKGLNTLRHFLLDRIENWTSPITLDRIAQGWGRCCTGDSTGTALKSTEGESWHLSFVSASSDLTGFKWQLHINGCIAATMTLAPSSSTETADAVTAIRTNLGKNFVIVHDLPKDMSALFAKAFSVPIKGIDRIGEHKSLCDLLSQLPGTLVVLDALDERSDTAESLSELPQSKIIRVSNLRNEVGMERMARLPALADIIFLRGKDAWDVYKVLYVSEKHYAFVMNILNGFLFSLILTAIWVIRSLTSHLTMPSFINLFFCATNALFCGASCLFIHWSRLQRLFSNMPLPVRPLFPCSLSSAKASESKLNSGAQESPRQESTIKDNSALFGTTAADKLVDMSALNLKDKSPHESLQTTGELLHF